MAAQPCECIYLTPPNCTLKDDEHGKFYVYFTMIKILRLPERRFRTFTGGKKMFCMWMYSSCPSTYKAGIKESVMKGLV